MQLKFNFMKIISWVAASENAREKLIFNESEAARGPIVS